MCDCKHNVDGLCMEEQCPVFGDYCPMEGTRPVCYQHNNICQYQKEKKEEDYSIRLCMAEKDKWVYAIIRNKVVIVHGIDADSFSAFKRAKAILNQLAGGID